MPMGTTITGTMFISFWKFDYYLEQNLILDVMLSSFRVLTIIVTPRTDTYRKLISYF